MPAVRARSRAWARSWFENTATTCAFSVPAAQASRTAWRLEPRPEASTTIRARLTIPTASRLEARCSFEDGHPLARDQLADDPRLLVQGALHLADEVGR